MRNLLKKLTCLALTFTLCVSFLGGCNLVTVDSERDLNQVIATIQIAEDIPEDKIYKKDVIMAYINYGYYYQQQGSEMGQIVEQIVSQLVNNRVYVQNAIDKFDGNDGIYAGKIADSGKDKWDLERYLTAEEILDAKYHTYKDMNDLVDAYVEDKPGDKVQDTLIEEVRTAPTGAANAEKELSDADKQEYINKGIEKNSRKKAYNEVVKVLKVNELLGDGYEGTIETSDYFKQTLKNYEENKIIEKFEKCVKDAARNTVTFDDVKAAYTEKYNAQSALDENGFAAMLDTATADEPVLVYNGKGSYGYVYNLLLGPSEEVLADVKEVVDNEKITDKEARRKEILDNGTIVKDLRSTWVLSGYDFNGTNFTGDYALADENSLPFKGKTMLLNEDDGSEDYKAEYRVDSVDEFSLDEFISLMETYLYGGAQVDVKDASNKSVYKKVNATGIANYVEKVNELLFAFSTDPGSLNTYKGYSSTPKADAGKDEKYMIEFANGARELLEMEGENSYIIVATDYGYHVMFYSEVFNSSYNYATLEEYLNKFEGQKDWAAELDSIKANFDDEDKLDTDSYLYKLFNSISTSIADKALSDEQGKILDYVFGDNDCVVMYEDRYADLLGK